jgi:hypothetical protein
MNDIKNLLIAFSASASTVFAAFESTATLISIISAVVLPIVFFTIGKAIDIAVQIHLERIRRTERESLMEKNK